MALMSPDYSSSGTGFVNPNQTWATQATNQSAMNSGDLGINPGSGPSTQPQQGSSGLMSGPGSVNAINPPAKISNFSSFPQPASQPTAINTMANSGMNAAMNYGAKNAVSALKGLFTCTSNESPLTQGLSAFTCGASGAASSSLANAAAGDSAGGLGLSASSFSCGMSDANALQGAQLASCAANAGSALASGTDLSMGATNAGADWTSATAGYVNDAGLGANAPGMAGNVAGVASDIASGIGGIGGAYGLINGIQSGNAVEAGLGAVGIVLAVLSWIICTELMLQGRMPRKYWKVGGKIFANYNKFVKDGYYVWAIPSVKHLRKHPNSLYSKFLETIFNWRAENIAAHSGVRGARKLWKGAAVTVILWPICFTLGLAVNALNLQSDWKQVYAQ